MIAADGALFRVLFVATQQQGQAAELVDHHVLGVRISTVRVFGKAVIRQRRTTRIDITYLFE